MSCEKGYALKGYTNKCGEFENCRRTDEKGSKCKECDTFYQPNEKGECAINFCFSFNDDGSCKECFENFYLDEDGNCQLNQIPYVNMEIKLIVVMIGKDSSRLVILKKIKRNI